MFRWPEEIPYEEYVRLYFLEKLLRRCVVDVLSKIKMRNGGSKMFQAT